MLMLQVRAEQDAYLAQLEAEGQLEGVYGKGVQVIQAVPGIVVKTKTADGATRVYINVCTCPKVWSGMLLWIKQCCRCVISSAC